MRKRVAIFPSGTEIGLEINNALKYSTHFEIFGFASMDDHSRFVYKNYVDGIPFYSDKLFISGLNSKIKQYNIDFIFPAHDDVQLFLTENQEKINATIITSELETVRICRSKSKTYNFFNGENFIPKVYESINEINQYPIFVKPDVGQGSRGARLVNNQYHLEAELNENPNLIMCEYLPGEEYTIDCFTDINGKLKVSKMRNRKRIKSGISVNSEVLPMEKSVLRVANLINDRFRFNGAWFFQLKRDNNNNFKLLEVAPRVSGTMGVNRNTGVNFPLLTLFNTLKTPVTIFENKYAIEVDRAFISRYKIGIQYNTIYLDLDDTLILNNNVNKFLMMFIYQAINEGKKIIILSKHVNNIYDTLEKYKISPELFEEIIRIKSEDEKAKYIKEKDSIFIDDSFSERYKVWKEAGIPVFDCSEVEALIDWSV